MLVVETPWSWEAEHDGGANLYSAECRRLGQKLTTRALKRGVELIVGVQCAELLFFNC